MHEREHQQAGISLEQHHLELEAEFAAITSKRERRQVGRQLRAFRAAIQQLAEGKPSQLSEAVPATSEAVASNVVAGNGRGSRIVYQRHQKA